MDIETRQDARKTPEAVTVLACVMGTIGVMPFVFIAGLVVVSNSFSVVSIWSAAVLVSMGAASAVSFVGLCALFCGCELGGRFAIPLGVSFGALAGPIGFVGLICPHLLRMVLGPDHRRLVPAVVFFGASLLVVADLVTRLLEGIGGVAPPVGVLTAMAGGPFFIYLLRTRWRRKIEIR